ncbi:MAG: hypothetical protein K0Q73_6096 [Paenibacillus sp.]|jgi:serine/threonine-protein kinase RsbW|nr:hypothetical protein [Paenibacillus sp.]
MADEVWFRGDWTIQSELGQEKYVASELRRTFQELQLTESRIDEMITAVSEACLNAIEHGNLLIKDLPVNVTLLIESDRYMFRITDQGNGTDIEAVNPIVQVRHKIDWDNPRGWGLQLIHQYSDSVCSSRYNGEFCIELHFLRTDSKGAGTD